MILLLGPDDMKGLITMKEAVDAMEQGLRETGRARGPVGSHSARGHHLGKGLGPWRAALRKGAGPNR